MQPLLARAAGLAELRLEVVGAAKTEAPLAFLSVGDATALRTRLLALAGRSRHCPRRRTPGLARRRSARRTRAAPSRGSRSTGRSERTGGPAEQLVHVVDNGMLVGAQAPASTMVADPAGDSGADLLLRPRQRPRIRRHRLMLTAIVGAMQAPAAGRVRRLGLHRRHRPRRAADPPGSDRAAQPDRAGRPDPERDRALAGAVADVRLGPGLDACRRRQRRPPRPAERRRWFAAAGGHRADGRTRAGPGVAGLRAAIGRGPADPAAGPAGWRRCVSSSWVTS